MLIIERIDIKQYIPLVNFLGSVLGLNSEIILYTVNLKSKTSYVEAVAGRKIDESEIDFDLETLKEKVYLKHDYVTNYNASSKKGLYIVSSAFL